MADGARERVLAIGVDAAERGLVRQLLDQRELPVLAALVDEGRWLDLAAPVHGSGAVWPTFFTASTPEEHGAYSNWVWRPGEMRVVPARTTHTRPLWSRFEDEGLSVGVVDVPFASHLGLERGFEVTEWGTHDVALARTVTSPSWVKGALPGRHPYVGGRRRAPSAGDGRAGALVASSLRGARLRGDLVSRLLARTIPDFTLVVFSEIHHAAHELWHTAAAAGRIHDGLAVSASPPPLWEVYREVDRQIGRILSAAPPGTRLAVFSLHGMRPARGVVTLLHPLLESMGFAVASDRQYPVRALSGLKSRTPAVVRDWYRRVLPRMLRRRLAAPTMVPSLDWARTRAFALPSDQHGWVRVNLAGRERDGTVPEREYERTRQELAAALAQVRTVDGEPVAAAVELVGGPSSPGPDLVVEWSEAAYVPGLRLDGYGAAPAPEAPWLTGQHTQRGFCVLRGFPAAGEAEEPVPVADLFGLLTDGVWRP